MRNKNNNISEQVKIVNPFIGRDRASSGRDYYGARRRWSMIGGKSLPSLAVLSVLALGAAHLFVTEPAQAQEDAAYEQPAPPRAAVIADEEQGVIRFVIDGKEVVRIDSLGLHVVGEVQYGGTLTDTGPAHIERYMAGGSHDE